MAKSPQPRPIHQPQSQHNYPQHTLDHYLTRSHYTAACHKASAGKAPGLDTISKETLKHLPESVHDLLYHLFQLMAKHIYTPKNLCTSATKLIYKPNKIDPHIPSNYRPIGIMNCILKLWTSILTSIGTQTAEA